MSTADTTTVATAPQPMPPEAQVVVQFEHVCIGFDGHTVLNDLSFSARTGETVIILGAAGAGKSILLKLANALIMPDSGRIQIFGQDIDALHQRELFAFRSNIGMVFQESALFDSLSVRDNVAFRLQEQRDDPARHRAQSG